MGKKRSLDYATNNSDENLSVPPGFVSLTSFTLKRASPGCKAADAADVGEKFKLGPISNADIDKCKTSLRQRPWILHNQFDLTRQQYDPEEKLVDLKCPVSSHLPKGVIRGCENCSNCVKVTASWHKEESCLPTLDDVPVFYPTEEEFKDTLKYVAKIRSTAEEYGLCRIVPPSSWRPPCLLQDRKTWEASKFSTHVQQIDRLQSFYLKRKLSTLHEMETRMSKAAAGMELESCNEGMADSEEEKFIAMTSEFETGPEHTLQSFKEYAGEFKRQYFSTKEPLIARIEGEYWRVIENPTEEIEVLCGTNLGSQILVSGFPGKTDVANTAECSKYVESGWNLINTPTLSGSLLPFGCYDTSAILLPQLFIGMCFASQCWRNEDHQLYSLCYMHMGDAKVWYGVPGRYCIKFREVVKKLFPQLSIHPGLLHNLVSQLPPSKLMSEGIPVYRCVQNLSEFVLVFPGAYHSEFSCGFNCSESIGFAPFDWLPYGQNIVELYSEYHLKTSISHDRLLLGAAIEAVNGLWESFSTKNSSNKNQQLQSVCGKEGILTKVLKSRVKNEGIRREHLFGDQSQLRAFDELDVATKRECSICSYDLYLSGVSCSCSPHTFSCLRHAKQLCTCAWGAKTFFFRYELNELNLLVQALEGNLKAIHTWAKRKVSSRQIATDKILMPASDKNPSANGEDATKPGSSSAHRLNGITASNENVIVSDGEKVAIPSSDQDVVLLSDEEDEQT